MYIDKEIEKETARYGQIDRDRETQKSRGIGADNVSETDIERYPQKKIRIPVITGVGLS